MKQPHESQADDDGPWGIRDDEMGFLRTFKTEYDRDQFYGAVSHRYIKPVLFGPAISDGEQLTECINSGQVSAAQVVAHAGTGELPEPACFRCWVDRSHDRGFYAYEDTMEDMVDCGDVEKLFTQDQLDALLAAERAEVARLREAAEAVLSNEEHAFSGGMRNYQKGSQTWQVYEDLRIALAAPGENHD